MNEHSTDSSAEPPVTTLVDGSVRVAAQDFALHIALRRSERRHSLVAVALAWPDGLGASQLWEFPVALKGERVLVGDAVATEGEAPLLWATDGESEWPLRVDHAFTRAFRVFSAVNHDRLVWAAILSGAVPAGNLTRMEMQS